MNGWSAWVVIAFLLAATAAAAQEFATVRVAGSTPFDRPVYLPGSRVRVRGVVRDVERGSYRAPEATAWILRIRDARGRLVWEKPRALSALGETYLAQVFPKLDIIKSARIVK